MEKKIFEPQLELLLLSKNFESLTADEKAYALKLITEEEYRDYAFMLKKYKPALLADYDAVQPSPKVAATLTHAFRAKNGGADQPQNWLAAAAVILVLIGCLYVFSGRDKKQQTQIVKINKRLPVINNTISKAVVKPAVAAKVADKKVKSIEPPMIEEPDYLGMDMPIIADDGTIIDPSSAEDIPGLNPANTTLLMTDMNDLYLKFD